MGRALQSTHPRRPRRSHGRPPRGPGRAARAEHGRAHGPALARRRHERPQHEGSLAHQRQDHRGGRDGRLRPGPAARRDRRARGRDHGRGLLGRDQGHRAGGLRRGAARLLVHGGPQPPATRRADRPGLPSDRHPRVRGHGEYRRGQSLQPVRPAGGPRRLRGHAQHGGRNRRPIWSRGEPDRPRRAGEGHPAARSASNTAALDTAPAATPPGLPDLPGSPVPAASPRARAAPLRPRPPQPHPRPSPPTAP